MAAAAQATGLPSVEFQVGGRPELDDTVLAAFVYGTSPPATNGGRIVHIGLRTPNGMPAVETWRTPRAATAGVSGPIRFAHQGTFLFGFLEVDEDDHGGVCAASETAYRMLLEFQRRRPERHLLRVWNYLYGINDGEGDLERYRQFCVGRARGLRAVTHEQLPAGTAVGRRHDAGIIQVCWLAATEPGLAVGNPRQTHAYLYPRQYGPAPPSFSRAMLLPGDELMASGTASIVGHQSLHDGDLEAQIDETLLNLRELRNAADSLSRPHERPGGDHAGIAVKVYLRCGDTAPAAVQKIMAGLPGVKNILPLEADICRRELLVEIECTWM